MMDAKIIVALDMSNEDDVSSLVSQLNPKLCKLKVGKELFTSYGPRITEKLVKLGFSVFLDLKFHDIPNTVMKACSVARELGVWMVNVHALGGSDMIRAAREALGTSEDRPLLTAVTVLTSMDQNNLQEIGFKFEPSALVDRLTNIAYQSGANGVVCSANEADLVKARYGHDFLRVTPGIRPSGGSWDDQKRVVTPSDAMRRGSSYLVVGRPITQSDNPSGILRRMNQEISETER